MTTAQQDENIVSGLYDDYQETQKEILSAEIRKTRVKLFTLAVVIFAFDLFAILVVNLLTAKILLFISVIPLAMVALAFLSSKEPMLSMVIAAVIIVGLWIYIIAVSGAQGAVSGWLAKAIIIYLLIAGFQSAREAQRLKKVIRA